MRQRHVAIISEIWGELPCIEQLQKSKSEALHHIEQQANAEIKILAAKKSDLDAASMAIVQELMREKVSFLTCLGSIRAGNRKRAFSKAAVDLLMSFLGPSQRFVIAGDMYVGLGVGVMGHGATAETVYVGNTSNREGCHER
jgi:hypothetical protein